MEDKEIRRLYRREISQYLYLESVKDKKTSKTLKIFLSELDQQEEAKVKLEYLKELKNKKIIESIGKVETQQINDKVIVKINPTPLEIEYNDYEELFEKHKALENITTPNEFVGLFVEVKFIPKKVLGFFGKKGLIKKIDIVKNQLGINERVVINDNRMNSIEIRGKSKFWETLSKLPLFTEELRGGEKEAKNIKDYFNSNRNNPIYKSGYSKTKIVEIRSGQIRPGLGIKIGTGTYKLLNHRLKKT